MAPLGIIARVAVTLVVEGATPYVATKTWTNLDHLRDHVARARVLARREFARLALRSTRARVHGTSERGERRSEMVRGDGETVRDGERR